MLFYILLMIAICKRRDKLFEDSFFKIYLADGAVSIISIILEYSINRPMSHIRPVCEYFHGNYRYPSYALTPYLYITSYVQFSKIFATVILCANRYTCVQYPVAHKTFWRRRSGQLVLVILILPVLFTWQIGISKCYIAASNSQAFIFYVHNIPWLGSAYFRMLAAIPSFIFIIFANYIIISKLSQIEGRTRSIERAMTISTIFLSIAYALFITIQGFSLIVSDDMLKESSIVKITALSAIQLCNDFYIMSSPIALIVTSRRIRRSLFPFGSVPIDYGKSGFLTSNPGQLSLTARP
ncbi:unnamed protein product [Caenorhabditis bovis]|uniref:Serpentine receptor class gamma n=1 Tax=Caenorhabditis bovis TaxID=2654633 RepID=A0A8S1EDJ6_9PELO|nr:unnamed protein product [Caenorhabditis bovis]